ncbi:hypothetical protein ACC733_39230, partial [Rhizobium johnstonii]|uniref:hypothetical protein n=1 Tax=Rhizobium johnstonii TaxID=3019933 RepID=UPI003F98AAE1
LGNESFASFLDYISPVANYISPGAGNPQDLQGSFHPFAATRSHIRRHLHIQLIRVVNQLRQ